MTADLNEFRRWQSAATVFLWKNRQHCLTLLTRGFPVLPENTSTPVVTEADAAGGGAPSASPAPTTSPASTVTPAPDRADLRPENIQDAVIRLAGNSQDGIQTAGAFLARLAGRSDQDVMTYMPIPSTISGGPSIFQVRIGSGEVLSAGDDADFLVAFYQHSYQNHLDFVRKGGIVLYDSDHVEPKAEWQKDYHHLGIPI